MKSIASLIKKSALNKIHLKNLDDRGFIILENVDYMKKNLHKLKKSEILINLEKDKGGWEGKEQYYKKRQKI